MKTKRLYKVEHLNNDECPTYTTTASSYQSAWRLAVRYWCKLGKIKCQPKWDHVEITLL